MPPEVAPIVQAYLGLADRLLPGRVDKLYVVGSTALGAFRPGRSDVDLVMVVDRHLGGDELRRLRALHLLSGAWSGARAAAAHRSPASGTCNTAVVPAAELSRPVSQIAPVASHTGRRFSVGRAFDVNPVVWKVLSERGIAVRGPAPSSLGLRPQPELLRSWNLANLDGYWTSWARAAQARGRHSGRLRPRWAVAWAALGAPRLHHTIATGEVVSKEAAGEYALDAFDRCWRPVIEHGLAYRTGRRPPGSDRPTVGRTADFVLEVVRSAHAL